MTKTVNSEQELKEQLAAIEHERWADWQKYVHGLLGRYVNEQSSEVRFYMLAADYVDRWNKQIATPYEKLSDQEKAADMEQVDRYWPLVQAYAEQTANQRAMEAYQDCGSKAGDGSMVRVYAKARAQQLEATLKQKEAGSD